jgi:hypothetical protein
MTTMTTRRPHHWPLPLLLGLLPLGCPADNVPGDDEVGGVLLPGDLVITEVMVSPDGSEEWFEIYNATGESIDLEGRELIYDKADGTTPKSHIVARSLPIEPGDYVVVAGMLDELAAGDEADHLDYGYANELGDFVSTRGHLVIRDAGEIVDEMYYGEPVAGEAATSGASRSFDGALSPDAVANDPVERWCDSRSEFDGPAFLATPGAANDLCSQAENCVENGVERAVDYAQPGDFVITEVHANAGIVEDDVGDWFEIHALTDFDLNGLEIGRKLEDPFEQQILAAECAPVSSGEYVVFVRELDTTLNGGIPADAFLWPTQLELTVTGSLWFSTPSTVDVPGTLIDAVTWSAKAGESTQLDPDFEEAIANDDLGKWCPATLPYGDGDLGSPGAVNEECAIAAPEGQCVDAGTNELRDIQPIPSGDLVITEFVANPVGDDAPGEWFEVLAKTGGDLNGLWIGKLGADYADEIVSETCIQVAANDYLVFAHDADPAVNGNLPQVDALFDLALNNSSSGLRIGYGATPETVVLADEITWTTTMEGISNSYGGTLDVVANDDLLGWCPGEPSTPGEANPSCGAGPPGMCTDPDDNVLRMIVAPSLGDLQLTEVMPNPDAATDALGEWFEIHTEVAFDLNGLEFGKNGVVEYTIEDPMCIEVSADAWLAFAVVEDAVSNCGVDPVTWVYEDLSLVNSNGNLFVSHAGTLLDEFSWPTSPTGATLSRDLAADVWCTALTPYGCGDRGTPAQPNPACDGMMGDMCLDEGVPRTIVVPQIGDLVISEFMANPAAVDDGDGEWFELRALADVDLNGLEFGNAAFMDGVPADLTLVSANCLEVLAGETRLFAADDDPLVNGGLPAIDFEIGFGLTNGNAFLYVGHGGTLLDQIGWTTTAAGASTSLDPDFYDDALNDVANDSDIAWCYETTVYGLGDRGTPYVDNGQCG